MNVFFLSTDYRCCRNAGGRGRSRLDEGACIGRCAWQRARPLKHAVGRHRLGGVVRARGVEPAAAGGPQDRGQERGRGRLVDPDEPHCAEATTPGPRPGGCWRASVMGSWGRAPGHAGAGLGERAVELGVRPAVHLRAGDKKQVARAGSRPCRRRNSSLSLRLRGSGGSPFDGLRGGDKQARGRAAPPGRARLQTVNARQSTRFPC